jgi:hypothetical protein
VIQFCNVFKARKITSLARNAPKEISSVLNEALQIELYLTNADCVE